MCFAMNRRQCSTRRSISRNSDEMRMDTTLLLSSGGGRSGEWIHCTSLREMRVGPPRGEKQSDPPLEDVHVAVDADVDVVE